jgi:hypothetical protein
MSTGQLRLAGAGLFFLVIFASGFWLSRSGKPYNGILFNVHKLIALGALVLFVMTLYRTNQADALRVAELIAALVTGLLALTLLVTGGLSSIEKPMPEFVVTLHHIAPYLAVISTGVTLFLLGRAV